MSVSIHLRLICEVWPSLATIAPKWVGPQLMVPSEVKVHEESQESIGVHVIALCLEGASVIAGFA